MITLYHLAISHYNEKVRWALDIKRVPHRRRAMVPGIHRFLAPRIAGERTLPGLIDTETDTRLGESSPILQYLDARFPEPRLYPDSPEDRARVLDLEAYLDRHAGTAVRAFSYGHLIDYPKALRARWEPQLSAGQRVALVATFPLVRRVLRRVYSLTPENTVRRAEKIRGICARVEGLLDEAGSGYLHGDSFGAADLTAVCLLGPLAQPPGSPWQAAHGAATELAAGFPPPALTDFRDEFLERRTGKWVLEVWDRHRGLQQPGAG